LSPGEHIDARARPRDQVPATLAPSRSALALASSHVIFSSALPATGLRCPANLTCPHSISTAENALIKINALGFDNYKNISF
jgi:hypothetical protein